LREVGLVLHANFFSCRKITGAFIKRRSGMNITLGAHAFFAAIIAQNAHSMRQMNIDDIERGKMIRLLSCDRKMDSEFKNYTRYH